MRDKPIAARPIDAASLALVVAILIPGCGEPARTDTSTPAIITTDMEREAEASGNYMMEQTQPKKKARAGSTGSPP